MKIPLCKPDIGNEEIGAVREVLESGMLVYGKRCREFERKFAGYIGTKYAVAMNSCTSALQLSIEALHLKGEIVVPSFTFAASANAIVLAGCKPVFADVDYDTRNISTKSIKSVITDNTVGVMPVHFGGQSCRMDEIMKLANEHDLRVIEDSAETLGGMFKDQSSGSFGDAGCFSFFPTKNMTTGEGGMITTNDRGVYDYVSLRVAHGIRKDGYRRDCVLPAYNMRMTDMQGAIGTIQLKKLDKMNGLRRKLAKVYNEYLSSLKSVATPLEDEHCRHVYQMYTITVLGEKRDGIVNYLKACGIGASVHFDPPVHEQLFYRENTPSTGNLGVTERLSKEILTLPMFPGMGIDEVDYVASKLKNYLEDSDG